MIELYPSFALQDVCRVSCPWCLGLMGGVSTLVKNSFPATVTFTPSIFFSELHSFLKSLFFCHICTDFFKLRYCQRASVEWETGTLLPGTGQAGVLPGW